MTLCEPLAPEDYRVQPMPDVSPPWWNIGHTSWFFARNVLHDFGDYTPDFARFEFALNSYYEALGPRLARARRGSVARPTTAEVLDYRSRVDDAMTTLLARGGAEAWPEIALRTVIGLEHEQQHQELLLSEVLAIRAHDPPELRRPYCEPRARTTAPAAPMRFVPVTGGLTVIGAEGDGFAWDNELPRHRAWVDDFAIADRLVTCGEWLEFIAAGGYRQPLLWLSNGWDEVQAQGLQAPLYWEERDGAWWQWTLRGLQPVCPAAPVCHVSFYEADAFARWAGARLPTEREWELAAQRFGFAPDAGNLLDDRLEDDALQTVPARGDGVRQLAGDVWEWTTSHYEPYPGYRPFRDALSEYNGKFMDNQRVLRGGSFATPREHVRATYRNFWHARTRFQFTGVRLAR